MPHSLDGDAGSPAGAFPPSARQVLAARSSRHFHSLPPRARAPMAALPSPARGPAAFALDLSDSDETEAPAREAAPRLALAGVDAGSAWSLSVATFDDMLCRVQAQVRAARAAGRPRAAADAAPRPGRRSKPRAPRPRGAPFDPRHAAPRRPGSRPRPPVEARVLGRPPAARAAAPPDGAPSPPFPD